MHSTKRQIIDTAFELFKNKGYDKVTVNEICDAVGITKPTFYYHLDSKEDILSEFYQTVSDGFAREFAQILSMDNYWEQLMRVFTLLIEHSSEIGSDLNSQLLIMNLRKDRHTFDFDPIIAQICVTLIEKAQQAGQIRNQSPPLLLFQVASHAFIGYELQWCIKKGSIDRQRLFRQGMENIFDLDPALRSQYAYDNLTTYIKKEDN